MSALVLHSYRRCPFAIRVRMTLEEKGVPYQVIEESLRTPSEALLRVNPSGKVPVLIYEGKAIPESAVITEFLDKKFPEPQLSRPEVPAWTSWCDENFKPDLDLFKYKWKELTQSQQGDLLTRLREHLEKIEDPLRKNAFLLGQEFTLADIHVFPFFRQLTKTADFAHHFQPLKAQDWLERITTRPSFERVMKKV